MERDESLFHRRELTWGRCIPYLQRHGFAARWWKLKAFPIYWHRSSTLVIFFLLVRAERLADSGLQEWGLAYLGVPDQYNFYESWGVGGHSTVVYCLLFSVRSSFLDDCARHAVSHIMSDVCDAFWRAQCCALIETTTTTITTKLTEQKNYNRRLAGCTSRQADRPGSENARTVTLSLRCVKPCLVSLSLSTARPLQQQRFNETVQQQKINAQQMNAAQHALFRWNYAIFVLTWRI